MILILVMNRAPPRQAGAAKPTRPVSSYEHALHPSKWGGGEHRATFDSGYEPAHHSRPAGRGRIPTHSALPFHIRILEAFSARRLFGSGPLLSARLW